MSQDTTCKKSCAAKRMAGVLLVGVAIAAVAIGGLREARRATEAGASGAAAAAARPAGMATVYYFHGDSRCDTCQSIERQTAELVRTAFAAEIAAGRVQFRAVNYDTAENRHFREDYKLSFGSVVVTDGARWENCSDVWTLVHEDRAAFDAYLTDRIKPFVEAAR